MESDNNSTAPKLYGEELLSEEGAKKENYIKDDVIKQVDVQLTGLKRIIKNQQDEADRQEIRYRGNDKRVGKLVSLAKLDKDTSIDIPKLPSLKRAERSHRGAISTYSSVVEEDLSEYSLREVQTERKKRTFLTALRRTGGNISKACAKCGMARVTIQGWMVKDVLFREEMMQLSEAIIDTVQDALMRKIMEGDTYAIIFYLKTIGKHRGYTEKLEVEGSKDDFDKMTDDELLREHRRLEAKIKGREGDT